MTALKKYSQIYGELLDGQLDSPKIRKRISSWYNNNIHYKKHGYNNTANSSFFSKQIEQEVGTTIPLLSTSSMLFQQIDKLLLECPIKDFLDSISVINYGLIKTNQNSLSSNWINFVERVFREEKSLYTIDKEGTIHPYIDEEFSISHQSTISLLDQARYGQVKAIYESAYGHMRSDKIDTRSAIKDMFESIETISKLLDNRIKSLSSNEVNNNLKSICESLFKDPDEKNFVKQMMASMAKWVDAHHIYRHGQGKEKHTPPSQKISILSLSIGSSFLRFLLQIDQKIQNTASGE